MLKGNKGAEETQGFIARNQKQLHIATIGAMCLLILLSIKLSADYEIFRDVFAAANTLIDIVLMAFLTMLFGFSASDKYEGSKQNLAFSLLIVVDFAMLFSSTLGYTVYGIAEKANFILVTSSLSYMLYYISFAVLWAYQSFFYKKTRFVKLSTHIICLLVICYSLLSVTNIFAPVLFHIDTNGFYDIGYLDYATVAAGTLLVVIMYVNILISDCDLKKKVALASYEIAPAVVIIFNVVFGINHTNVYLPTIADVALMFPLYIIFYSIYVEQKNEIRRKEIEQMQMETSLMLSQIQPHFLYNCLSTIAVLCEEDPVLAEKATTTFAEYLRENMNCIGSETPISFLDEMHHVEGYVWLEKLRFSDRVNVEYKLSCTDFSIPALTVQPLVENAIKHGVCKGIHPGTVTISSCEDSKSYIITIIDDGVGFEPSQVLNDGRQHVGIESVRKRLQSIVGGSMKIETAPNKGTEVTITIPKIGGA